VLRARLPTWKAGNCCGTALNVDDVGFIKAVIERVSARYNVHPDSVYVTGIYNGGMMAHRIGCGLTAIIAAIGPVAE